MQELTIDQTREIQLEIADEIDRICRAEGIEYFLGYGSALGAMRHGGFIPWDDDMDLIMMRADYERFYEAFDRANRVERFKLVSYRDRTAPNAFLKVVDTTTWVEERYSEAKYGSGVWVDIFPYDEVDPADERILARERRAQALRYLIVTDPSTGGSPVVRLAKRIVCPVLKRRDPFEAARKIDEMAREHGRAREAAVVPDGERLVADLVAEPTAQRRYPKSLFVPMEVDFSGHRYFVPERYDDYLTAMYGDWRTPPSESHREMHTCRAYRL